APARPRPRRRGGVPVLLDRVPGPDQAISRRPRLVSPREVAASTAPPRDGGGQARRRWGRLVRGVTLLAGLSIVGYLLYRVGPERVWNSVRTLGWRLPIVLCFPYALTTTLDTLAWRFALLPRPAPFAAMWGAR